jgi:hypothetical protein
MYHGFRKTRRRKNLKYSRGYIIPATKHEDSGGIDFWVKMPRDERLFPLQVTQRGVSLYRKHRILSDCELQQFIKRAEVRIEDKRKRCKRHGIAFVLVRDYLGKMSNPTIAWGDIKALRYGIAHLKRWL